MALTDDELIEDFKKMSDDTARWQWIVDINQHQRDHETEQRLSLVVDNDITYLLIGGVILSFNDSIGNMPGIFDLLNALHLKHEAV